MNVRVGLNNGHLTKSLRNYFVNVRSPAEVAIPWLHLEVRNAAVAAVPGQQAVLTLSAKLALPGRLANGENAARNTVFIL